ncbi:MAG: efflux RND transporter periplasmic adaptor subunit [Candidatus Marinimicrobia bacterium]|nr:efflux RND transporter periplasmic adaptor subunit [Candidatus Neomarinimicrobiota bacterium]
MKKSILLILSISLLVFSCGKKTGKETTEEQILSVKVEKLITGHIEDRVKYLGNIEANNEVLVYSLIPQKITSIQADVNDIVKKDQVLATVKNVEVKQGLLQAEAGVSSAKAQLENIKTEWERTQKLYEQQAISKAQFDAVKAQMEAAEAGVKQAEAMLKSTNEQYENSFIKSPIAGVVSARNYDMGDQTSPQMPAFTVVDMEKVKIKVDLVEEELHKVKEGAKAYIEVKGMEGREFIGKVHRVHPTVDPLTRTVTAEILVDNADLKLRPGMYAKVNIVTESSDNALLLPNHAIIEKTYRQWQGGEVTNAEIIVAKYCYIVKDGKTVKVDLKTGISNAQYTQILEGLSTADDVIVIGQHNVSDNQDVKIVND